MIETSGEGWGETNLAQLLRGEPVDEDDDPQVRRANSLDGAMGAGERILWEGAPSPRHAWGDHDQLEPVRQTPMQPRSLLGRVLMAAIVTALILWAEHDARVNVKFQVVVAR